MIVLTAVYTIRPTDADSILADLADMTEKVRQNEPGCLTYRVHRGLDQPDKILLYEAYRDQESLDAHGASPHFQSIVLGRIVPKLLSRERTFWEPVNDL